MVPAEVPMNTAPDAPAVVVPVSSDRYPEDPVGREETGTNYSDVHMDQGEGSHPG